MPYNNFANNYIDNLINEVCETISTDINLKNIEELINDHFSKRLNDKSTGTKFKNFQEYYYKTLRNRDYFLDNNFFSEFRQKYSLRGIDKDFINRLEKNKRETLKTIDSNELVKLYTEYFAKAQIKHNENLIEKNLGSFFTKLVHTFKPEEYTPLDNAIKKHFGLTGESYFIAMIVVSRAYIKWANEHREEMDNVKKQLNEKITKCLNGIVTNELTEPTTDLKLLNILFWSIAEKK